MLWNPWGFVLFSDSVLASVCCAAAFYFAVSFAVVACLPVVVAAVVGFDGVGVLACSSALALVKHTSMEI